MNSNSLMDNGVLTMLYVESEISELLLSCSAIIIIITLIIIIIIIIIIIKIKIIITLAYFYCATYTRMKANNPSTNCYQRSHYKKSQSVHNRCNFTRQTAPACRSRVRESAFFDLATKGWQFVPGAGG